MIRNFTVWGLGARPSQSYCDQLIEEVALLSKREMKQLFPDATVLSERFAGLPKSLIAVKASTRGESVLHAGEGILDNQP